MRTSERGPAGRRLWGVAVLSGVVAIAGCGSGEPAGEAPAETEDVDHAEHAADPASRVFFVEPADGATVRSPVRFVFGIENYTIAPVPEGTVEEPRAGMGHHHLGVNTGCLPAATEIPRGTPGWVHFGKGDNTIDMQLEPGTHRFALQVGNDLHQTVDGLCETISITVTE